MYFLKSREVELSEKAIAVHLQLLLKVYHDFEIRLHKTSSYLFRPTDFSIGHQMKCIEHRRLLYVFLESSR